MPSRLDEWAVLQGLIRPSAPCKNGDNQTGMALHQTISIHPDAPAKPAWGEHCNGCGVCCAAEPCPVGVLVSGRRWGACRALEWHAAGQRYVCGMVNRPERYLGVDRPWLNRAASALTRRLISAGSGCDSDAQTTD